MRHASFETCCFESDNTCFVLLTQCKIDSPAFCRERQLWYHDVCADCMICRGDCVLYNVCRVCVYDCVYLIHTYIYIYSIYIYIEREIYYILYIYIWYCVYTWLCTLFVRVCLCMIRFVGLSNDHASAAIYARRSDVSVVFERLLICTQSLGSSPSHEDMKVTVEVYRCSPSVAICCTKSLLSPIPEFELFERDPFRPLHVWRCRDGVLPVW